MPKRSTGLIVGYTPRPDVEVAAEIFANLCALDANYNERTELLASGVSPHRVEFLYGSPYAVILPGLMKRLRSNPNTALHSDSHMSLIQAKNRDFLSLRMSEDPKVAQRWLNEEWDMRSTPENEAFQLELRVMQVCDPRTAGFFVAAFINLLLNSWWVMANRYLLGGEQQEWADQLVSLASWDLFPFLRPAQG